MNDRSTALTTKSARQAAAPKPEIAAGGPIAALVPQNIDQAFRLSQALAEAGDMVPRQYQGKPREIMAAVMRGAEVGLAPMQALSSIAVINGRASLWGDALPALMQRAGHHIDVVIENEADLEKARAVATLTRGDTGKVVVRTFSMADAKRAGLSGKQGPWTQYPLRMLANRARAFAIRDGAADALMGLAMTDEVSDYGPDRARDVTPKPPKGGAVYIDPEPAAEAEPERDEVLDAEAYTEDPAPSDEDRQRAMDEARAESERQAAEGGL